MLLVLRLLASTGITISVANILIVIPIVILIVILSLIVIVNKHTSSDVTYTYSRVTRTGRPFKIKVN